MRPVLLLIVSVLLVAGACGDTTPSQQDLAQEAWEAFQSDPNEVTYRKFIHENRFAAHGHEQAHDALGVKFQVRAIEAQAQHAAASDSEQLAWKVVERVEELEREEMIDVFEEVFEGSAVRLGRAKVQAQAVIDR